MQKDIILDVKVYCNDCGHELTIVHPIELHYGEVTGKMEVQVDVIAKCRRCEDRREYAV